MKPNDRLATETVTADPTTQPPVETRTVSTLADEVKARQKPSTNPIAVAQKLSQAEFNMAMVHFYRGEIQRSNVWRSRLDTTTNWAVLTTGATLSFIFSSPDSPHFAIPINTILVAIFMFMEARRYRYYEVWANRVRVLETGYFSPMLSHQMIPPDTEWADHLAADLMTPHFTITDWEAIGKRLRSNYIWIFVLLGLSWTLKVYLHPFPIDLNSTTKPWTEVLLDRTAVGLVPGWIVLMVGALFNISMIAIAIFTLKLKDAKSEVLPFDKVQWHPLRDMSNTIRRRTTIRRSKKARQRVRSGKNSADENGSEEI